MFELQNLTQIDSWVRHRGHTVGSSLFERKMPLLLLPFGQIVTCLSLHLGEDFGLREREFGPVSLWRTCPTIWFFSAWELSFDGPRTDRRIHLVVCRLVVSSASDVFDSRQDVAESQVHFSGVPLQLRLALDGLGWNRASV